MNVEVSELSIRTTKEYLLSATSFIPEKSNNRSLLISSATGVLQKYYHPFSNHFAELGYTVYTFDYRGIGKSGGSDIKVLKNKNLLLRHWGSIDQAAVTAHAKTKNPDHEIILVTHSIGGQILGFNANHFMIDKVILVASQGGFWKLFKGIHRLKMLAFWYVLIPFLTFIWGYFPSKHLGLFENLPMGMAREWAQWGRQKEYMMPFYRAEEYFFDKIKIPMLALSFPKDVFASEEAVNWLTQQFSNAKIERIHYVPEKNAINSLKHFGFFRKQFEKSLWKLTHDWISK